MTRSEAQAQGTLFVRVPYDQLEALDRLVKKEADATGHNVSRAAIVRRMIAEALAKESKR
jgi:hypothetical protein